MSESSLETSDDGLAQSQVEHIAIEHSRFSRVQKDIFLKHLAPNCMEHSCALKQHDDKVKLDACCQYGVDVDLGERDGILRHADELRAILGEEVRDRPWFKEEVESDPDFPSGKFVRTRTFGEGLEEGCLFLRHDGRGCAIHRASLEGGWDFHGIKPHVCRLFPVSYDDQGIVMSDDYADYSCAFEANSPSVYRVQRSDIGAIFGQELVRVLDKVEADLLREANLDNTGSLPVIQE